MSNYKGYDEKSKIRTMRYKKAHRERLSLDFPKGKKQIYKDYAASQVKSLNALFVELIKSDMKFNGYSVEPKAESNTELNAEKKKRDNLFFFMRKLCVIG